MKLSRRELFAALIGAPVALPGIAMAAAAASKPALTVNTMPVFQAHVRDAQHTYNYWMSSRNEVLALTPRLPSNYVTVGDTVRWPDGSTGSITHTLD